MLDCYKPPALAHLPLPSSMPTAVKQEPELRSIGLHEEKPSYLNSKSRPAPSPATRSSHLFTPPPEFSLPPLPTYNYNQDAFDYKSGGSRKSSYSSVQSNENGARRNSKAMGSISGKGMLINPSLSRAKLVDLASKVSLAERIHHSC